MALKKINIRSRKGAATLLSIVLALIIGLAIFFGGYLYWQKNAESAGLTVDSQYSDTYVNLNASYTTLDNNVNDIKNNIDSIREADNTWEVAWNGLKGLGNTIKLPISFTSTTFDAFQALGGPVQERMPSWVYGLVGLGIIAVVVLIVLANLKGEGKTV